MTEKVENEYQRTKDQKSVITHIDQIVTNPTWMIVLLWHGMERDIETALLRDADMTVPDLRDWIFAQCPTGCYVSSRHYRIEDVEFDPAT